MSQVQGYCLACLVSLLLDVPDYLPPIEFNIFQAGGRRKAGTAKYLIRASLRCLIVPQVKDVDQRVSYYLAPLVLTFDAQLFEPFVRGWQKWMSRLACSTLC